MGLAKVLFGFDKKDLEELRNTLTGVKAEVGRLQEELAELKARIDDCEYKASAALEIADKSDSAIQSLRSELDSLRGEREALEARLEEIEAVLAAIEERSEKGQDPQDTDEAETLILSLVKTGIDTPGELMEHTGLSKGRLYAILRRLVERGVLVKKREGRKVHYVIVEEVNT